MSKSAPFFTVVIPTYNRPAKLERAVRSVLCQTFSDFEVVVVDDASDERVVLSGLPAKVKLIRSERNAGPGTARNLGIEIAAGEYVAFLDDDDEYLEKFLENAHRVLLRGGAPADFCWSSVKMLEYNSQAPSEVQETHRLFAESYASEVELFESLMSVGTGFGFIARKECLDRVGGFNQNLRAVEDTDLFLKLLSNEFIPTVISEPNIVVHNHNDARLTSVSMNAIRIRENTELLDTYCDFLECYPNLRRKIQNHISYLANMT